MQAEIVINNKTFDYSEKIGAYINRENEALPMVFDGVNVVPLQYYELSQTDTVHQNGDVSRTTTLKNATIQTEYENSFVLLETKKLKLSIQLYDAAIAFISFCLIVFGIGFAVLVFAYVGALVSNAEMATAGALEALNEIMYYGMWALAIGFLFVVAKYAIKAKMSQRSECDLTPEQPTPQAGANSLNISINQGYNNAQNIVQPPK
jgi:hypothetical protein